MRILIALCALAILVPAPATAVSRGTTFFALEIGQGRGDFANPARDDPNFLLVDLGDHPTQIEARAEIWRLFAEDWAVTLSGGTGFFSEQGEPASSAAPGTPEYTFSSSSFAVRAGVDRMGDVGERLVWFLGPGLEYWNGKTKFENVYGVTPPDDEVESPSVTRFSISGRVGGIMKLSDALGIVGHVGHRFGIASADEGGAKTSWWPSGFNAAWGLLYAFGAR
jgi:hypothetical protein